MVGKIIIGMILLVGLVGCGVKYEPYSTRSYKQIVITKTVHGDLQIRSKPSK